MYSPPRFFLFLAAVDAVAADDLDAARLTPRAAGIMPAILQPTRQ